jgi:hypothetical protein
MASGAPGCELCGCMTYSQEWYTAFGVMLCAQCKRESPLISKVWWQGSACAHSQPPWCCEQRLVSGAAGHRKGNIPVIRLRPTATGLSHQVESSAQELVCHEDVSYRAGELGAALDMELSLPLYTPLTEASSSNLCQELPCDSNAFCCIV